MALTDPLVTCFIATRNRRAWLPVAIECFATQTYENLRLVVLDDGEQDCADLVSSVGAYIRCSCIPILADKFNEACHAAPSWWSWPRPQGELLCKLDSDDWYAPDHIAKLVALMQSSGKSVVGYNSALFHDGASWYRYNGPHNFALGASLCFTREWWTASPFRPQIDNMGRPFQVGSDTVFVKAAADAGQLATVDGGESLVASIHSENTSRRDVTSMNSSYARLPDFPGVAGYRWPLTQQVAA